MIFEWGKPLGAVDRPYAYRWRLDFYWFSLRLHKWMCSDDTRAYHSHPVNMLVFVLTNAYIDTRPERRYIRTAPCMYRLYRNTKHYVFIPQLAPGHRPVWSFVITWGAPKRWAFWDKITGKKKNRDRYFIENGHHHCDN